MTDPANWVEQAVFLRRSYRGFTPRRSYNKKVKRSRPGPKRRASRADDAGQLGAFLENRLADRSRPEATCRPLPAAFGASADGGHGGQILRLGTFQGTAMVGSSGPRPGTLGLELRGVGQLHGDRVSATSANHVRVGSATPRLSHRTMKARSQARPLLCCFAATEIGRMPGRIGGNGSSPVLPETGCSLAVAHALGSHSPRFPFVGGIPTTAGARLCSRMRRISGAPVGVNRGNGPGATVLRRTVCAGATPVCALVFNKRMGRQTARRRALWKGAAAATGRRWFFLKSASESPASAA